MKDVIRKDLKDHLKIEYKINGEIDCYPTTSSKAADLINSYIEVGGNNNNKNHKTTGNDNEDEQVAGSTEQNKYNAQVKDKIIGMLMDEGCDLEGLERPFKD
jgi:hypothetical protein